MRIRFALILLAAVMGGTAFAATDGDPGEAAVAALGKLNGVALQCRHFGEAKRIKQAMIAWAPKTTGLGTAFENATNEGFMETAQAGGACPGGEEMARRVDTAVAALREQFP